MNDFLTIVLKHKTKSSHANHRTTFFNTGGRIKSLKASSNFISVTVLTTLRTKNMQKKNSITF